MRNVNKQSGTFSFICKKKYKSSVLVLFLCIFVQYSYRTLVALWIRLDYSKGGVGWDSVMKTGMLNCSSGVICMVLPLVLTDTFKNRFGIKKSCILLSVLIMIPNSFVALARMIEGVWVWTLLIFCNGFCVAICTIYLSIISIAVTNSVHESVAGAAIGLSQSIVSVSRALSSSGTAVLFGFLKENQQSYQVDVSLLFYINDLICLLTIGTVYLFIGHKSEKRKVLEEKKEFAKQYDICSTSK